MILIRLSLDGMLQEILPLKKSASSFGAAEIQELTPSLKNGAICG
jgi:hypothetical protein